MPVMTGNVFFPPKSNECNINIDLDSYATKAEVKALTGVDTGAFVKKTDFTKIKGSVDKIERDEKKNAEDFKKLKETVDGSDIVSVKKDIAGLKSSTDILKTNVTSLEGTINKNGTDYGVLKGKVEKYMTDYSSLKGKVDKNTTDYRAIKARVDQNTKNYETLKKEIDNIKPGTGLPPSDYVKRTDYDKDKAAYVKKTDYASDKNKLLSTDEYEKDKQDELELKKDLIGYTKKDELNTSVSTLLKSTDSDNPLGDSAKKSYVADKVKNIKGADLSGYTKQTDFIAHKDKIQKYLGNYTTKSQLMTLQANVAKDYLLRKDLDVTNIKKTLSAVMGRDSLSEQKE